MHDAADDGKPTYLGQVPDLIEDRFAPETGAPIDEAIATLPIPTYLTGTQALGR